MAGTSSEAASVHGRADHRGRGMFRRPGTSMAGESTNRWVDDRTGPGARSGQADRAQPPAAQFPGQPPVNVRSGTVRSGWTGGGPTSRLPGSGPRLWRCMRSAGTVTDPR